MSELKAGDAFPEGVAFTYIPPAPEIAEFSQCGIPIRYNASKGNSFSMFQRNNYANKLPEFESKKIVLVSIPGAFTPTCSGSHIPSYTANVDALKAKGVDHVIVVAFNDPYVMSGWGKANGVKDDFIVSFHPVFTLSEDNSELTQSLAVHDRQGLRLQQADRLDLRRRPNWPLRHCR